MKTSRLNIHTFMSNADNETFLGGTNHNGKERIIVFDTIELMEWLDIHYMKEKTKEYIDNL